MFIWIWHDNVKFLDGVMEPLVFLIANKMMIIIWPAAITEIGIHGAPRTCWLVGFIFLVHVRYRSIGTLRYERFIWSWSDSNFGHFCWSVNPCVKIWLFIIENHFSRDKSHISENHHKHNNLNCVSYIGGPTLEWPTCSQPGLQKIFFCWNYWFRWIRWFGTFTIEEINLHENDGPSKLRRFYHKMILSHSRIL